MTSFSTKFSIILLLLLGSSKIVQPASGRTASRIPTAFQTKNSGKRPIKDTNSFGITTNLIHQPLATTRNDFSTNENILLLKNDDDNGSGGDDDKGLLLQGDPYAVDQKSPALIGAPQSSIKHQKAFFSLPPKAKGFIRSGTKDSFRVVHSVAGLLSILVGLHHAVEITVLDSFAHPIDIPTIVSTGGLYSLVGLFGIRRLSLKEEKEAARNAMYIASPLQNMWLTSAAITECGQGSSSAVFSMFQEPFVCFTILNLVATIWQLNEVWNKSSRDVTKDSIWQSDPVKNALLAEFAYLFWIQIQMIVVLYIQLFVNPDSFLRFTDSFSEMPHLLSNMSINSAWFNNIALLVATMIRYRLLSKPSSDNIIVFAVPILTSLYFASHILSCFLGTANGEMALSFVRMLYATRFYQA